MDLIRGYGMTIDEYFDQPIVIETYRTGNEIALLRQQIFTENELEFGAEEYTGEELVEMRQQLIDEIKQELLQQADIVFMDE
ncbi:MAG: hypothetical protein Q4B48_08620 [Syntrophomonadaceae bacterium]|nr:hypothetical protein [Syntrophomonadaceae bacterium]